MNLLKTKGIMRLEHVPKQDIKKILEYNENVGVIVYKDLTDNKPKWYDVTVNLRYMDTEGYFKFVYGYRISSLCHGIVLRYYLLVCYEMENAGDEQQ